MKKLGLIIIVIPVLMLWLSHCGGDGAGDSSRNSDCQEAERLWGQNKTSHLGDECSSGSYGSCPENYDNCIEGVCKFSSSANDDICTKTCTGNSQCGSGSYCKDGICQPAATCKTYCDGYMCCRYSNDPNDPTRCIQGECWLQ